MTQYFCSQRCAQKFDDAKGTVPTEDDSFDAVDPVSRCTCTIRTAPSALGPDGVTYYSAAGMSIDILEGFELLRLGDHLTRTP